MKIGILALQGAYEAHANMLSRMGVEWQFVRNIEDLEKIDGLIIPGGESPTLIKLLQENNLFNSLQQFSKPMFGTCAGAILLAEEVFSPKQISLKRINISIERNAYGRQLASRIVQGHYIENEKMIELIFIRAPRICKINAKDIKIIASYSDEPVAVQQKNILVATFHPELTSDSTLHEHFISMVKKDLKH